jgi:hypothetical protein
MDIKINYMKRKTLDNIKAFFLITLLIILTRRVDILPWWSFVIPVLILGSVTGFRKWEVAGFFIGFSAGFAIWFGASIYFNMSLGPVILDKVSVLFSVSKGIVLLLSGIMGGLLTGLAFYTGNNIAAREKTII